MSPRPDAKSLNLYQVLSLPPPGSGYICSNAEIKAAYRKALLHFHPDKAKVLGLQQDEQHKYNHDIFTARYSIDDIGKARDILLDPISRKDYDQKLRLSETARRLGSSNGPLACGTGYETIDLEDMEFSETTSSYWMACRCGNDTAFQISEDELAREVEQGEIFVGCPGCSLQVRIVFEASTG